MTQTPTTRTLACRMPSDLHEELTEVIDATGHNVNGFIIESVDSYIRLIKGNAEETKQLKVARFAYNIDNPNAKNKQK